MKKLIFRKEFDGDENKLPQREHPEGAVPFKEPSLKALTIIANVGAVFLMFFFVDLVGVRTGEYPGYRTYIALILSLLSLFPHEILHALCFKETVYMYTYLKKGLMFVVGPEDMSKLRFIMMSLCPNIIFGFIPFLAGMIFPKLITVALFGALCIGMGFGDYINIFNALTQMPKGAKTYMHGSHSYWYEPGKTIPQE